MDKDSFCFPKKSCGFEPRRAPDIVHTSYIVGDNEIESRTVGACLTIIGDLS